jgi:flagellar biosynthesis/type III secretory pathway protein FliH
MRETLLLRLLGSGRVLREALEDLSALPDDAWEKSITTPLLVRFRLASEEPSTSEEDDVSAEIRAWFKEYEQNLRSEARKEGLQEGLSKGLKEGLMEGLSKGLSKGLKEGERTLLLRLLRARFGELPETALARIEAAGPSELEQWGERVLNAQTLDDVLGNPS